ncbi:Putative tannase/feruloyl esterase, alpha/Beta hydrolase [Septoria linicola]|uniref:Carboxylic ester hydrolase n=1 Tax=Septoria linicola TaxID=215465 RepID=A0A9Q9AKA7_9PEZI|nr:putative tannase/feruloyl esterase, alpha/Beta hydrolase [Septoria linicola]USW48488.1 Putative tannase/feruloyl esterase, alpha/Beta hydrolase [Septoria linicola]
MATVSCANLCSSLSFTQSDYPVHPVSCRSYAADSTITITGGQAQVGCGTTFQADVDLCRVVLTIETSDASETYMEVWLPENGQWNGRTMNTDNGGVNGCVHYVDMQYVSGRGFAAIGDNAGHNGSSFDGSWFADDNEVILDWVYRARHSAVVAGKEVVNQFYDQAPEYSYYIGCSAGGAQGMKSAQMFPDDFDGIIAGSSAADFNHLQAWSGRFVQLTGTSASDARFLTQNDWITVQSAIFDQCDAAIDGVDDGILEDPTQCVFDSSVLSCTNNATLSGCLTDTQVSTVNQVFAELYNTEGELLFPALLYGSQVDAFRLGQLSGSVQAISEDWYKYAVLDDPNWSALDMDQADYAAADALDAFHGNVSQFSGDLRGFQASGGKLLMYHGMADPLVSGSNSQRYYLKTAATMGLDHTALDNFYRYFRISGMAHCGVGGISGAGAWMFGQNAAASIAPNNIIDYLRDWVEDGNAPDTITGTKYWYDTQSLGIQLERAHCRFPYRNTYQGGDASNPASWSCVLIDDWRECGPGALPRLCNVDGSFN